MADITLLPAIIGGGVIGLAAGLLAVRLNKVAGISGIAAGILPPWQTESLWRLAFLAGLLLSGVIYRSLIGEVRIELDASMGILAIAGLLVGYGSRLGGGCTSGHGICGISRLSIRSIIATLTFMSTAGLSVYIVRHLL